MNQEPLASPSSQARDRGVRVRRPSHQRGRRYWMRLGRAAALAAIGIGVQLWIDGALRMPSGGTDEERPQTATTAADGGSGTKWAGARLVLASDAVTATPVGTAGMTDTPSFNGAAASAMTTRGRPPAMRGAPQSSDDVRPAADSAAKRRVTERPAAARPIHAISPVPIADRQPTDTPVTSPGFRRPVPAPMHPRPTLASARSTAPIASLPVVAPLNPPQPAVRMDEADSILRVLHQYRRAVERMDARAAQAVWPSLDARALARAFTGLESNSLDFEDCGVTISAAEMAQAQCRAVATYLPKVGRRKPVNAEHEYTFTFSKTGGDWRIDSAAIR